MTTSELVDHVKRSAKPVKAHFHFGYFKCTHYLIFHDGVLFDEGIDGEEKETTPEAFVEFYPEAEWRINEERELAPCQH